MSEHSGAADPRPAFDPLGPLDGGRLAVEASAGTGKTYALSTLAARHISERDVPIRELLVVTFTRAAAAELRDRLRGRLLEFAAALEPTDEPDDEVLAAVRSEEPELRLARVQTAISEFDSATITTIHGFAQQIIGTLGSTARTDPDAVLVDDTDELVTQAATDVLAGEVLTNDDPALSHITLTTLRRSALLFLGNPGSRFEPAPDLVGPGGQVGDDSADGENNDGEDGDGEQGEIDAAAAILRRLTDQVVQRVAAHRTGVGTLSFDDLLVRLRDILVDPQAGSTARTALESRFSVALIDEFQDTDPVQWSVFNTLFGGSPDPQKRSMVMVGDPKQAIYAFRGANVHTYLQAVRDPATEVRKLATNWRSDPALLKSTATLLRGSTFGADDISFHDVAPATRNLDRGFTDSQGSALPAISLRAALGDEVTRQKAKKRPAYVEQGAQVVFADLARHVRCLLEESRIPDDEQDDGVALRPLRPDDVAVLIAKNAQGPAVRDALGALGIPAVIARGDSVLNSEAATHWHRLLHAIARPSDPRRVRAACTSWFFGMDAASIAAMSDQETTLRQEELHEWGTLLSREGVSAMVGRILTETAIAARVLALPQGDRHMTDLDHLAELLCGAVGANTGPVGLLETFEDLGVRAEDGDPETDVAARRVESESRAVQIMTTFVAKGLEFPVVCCPTLWDSAGTSARDHIWWDGAAQNRVVDLAPGLKWGSPDEHSERKRLATEELAGTNLRLLYVALTRAQHHTAIWWLPTTAAWRTGLARVLFARDESGAIDRELFAAPTVRHLDDDATMESLESLVRRQPEALEAVIVGTTAQAADDRAWTGSTGDTAAPLAVATLGRTLDRARGRWSFTAIAARHNTGSHHGYDAEGDTVGDAANQDEGGPDEGDPDETATGDVAAEQSTSGEGPAALPLGPIAGGATFGTLVHEILERVDFCSENLLEDLRDLVGQRLRFNPWPVDHSLLASGIAAVIETPLGPLFDGRPLRTLARADRLDEVDFDLTLGESGPRATDTDIAALVLEHLEPGDPHREWAESFAAAGTHTVLAGHLTGSIDLVARVIDSSGVPRFVVVDYKTNRLAPWPESPTIEQFAPDRLHAPMAEHDYPLQALLYSVALHRYLRWRLPDYEPEVHLGGIGYMFVRGMVGPDTPTLDGTPHGLAAWRPPCELVVALSQLLDGGGRS